MTTPTSEPFRERPRAAKPLSAGEVRIPERLFFRIGDVADLLGVKPHVLRYWESEFPIISPQKSLSGQRVYRRSDVETLVMIRNLLHEQRYSIEGARRKIRELRKDGQLKAFKEETRSPSSSSSQVGVDSERLTRARELARKPISDLFR